MKLMTRWMNPSDIDDVEYIENLSSVHPWSADTILSLRSEYGVLPLLATDYNKTIGFLFMHLSHDVISIIHMAVHPDYRRRGVGSKLIGKVKQKLTPQRQTILAEVRESDTPAHFLFKKHGFIATKILWNHFQDELIDVECPPGIIYEDGYHFEFEGNSVAIAKESTLQCGV